MQAPIDERGASASPAASLSVRHKRSDRCCLMWHQRKIRCDKKSPRSHCVRADVLCCYPPKRTSRRPHKTTIAEVAARLARFERMIMAISNVASHTDSNGKSISALTPPLGEVVVIQTQTVGVSPEELLAQDGYSSRARKSSSFDIGGMFSGFNQSMTDTQSYHPSRWHAMQLWQTFVNNVDPIAKILHIPTT
jgi:hypothetical protein